jgi:hypothetical protein
MGDDENDEFANNNGVVVRGGGGIYDEEFKHSNNIDSVIADKEF